jgi:hypothetical protein
MSGGEKAGWFLVRRCGGLEDDPGSPTDSSSTSLDYLLHFSHLSDL